MLNRKPLSVLFLLTGLLWVHPSGATSSILEIWSNNRAVDHLIQKKTFEAHQEFTELLMTEPFHPVFQFNLAGSFLAVEDPKNAVKMFEQILKMQPLPPEVEFASHYNLGVIYSLKETQDIEKALAAYQKALAFQPQSKEIKTNIELLLQGGKGKGKGDNKDKSDQNQDPSEGDEQKEPQEFTNQPQQQQDQGKGMSERDVKNILEELKKQEQRIRAKHERKGPKEERREKDW